MADNSPGLDELAQSLPIDEIAARIGEQPDDVRRAVDVALPALFGGLQANAADPGGAESIAEALGQHDAEVASRPISLADVDPADGERITAHIFGAQRDEVVNRLGSQGASSDLLRKLIPILAPIVLSYLAKQAGGRGGSAGILGTILASILGGAAQGTSGSGSGGGLGGVLGGLLGGGRKS